jgi:TRAP-type C4-dicarboxylate transport system permease small subunit
MRDADHRAFEHAGWFDSTFSTPANRPRAASPGLSMCAAAEMIVSGTRRNPGGARPVIEKAFDFVTRVIEMVLALAFIAAVLLNFTNAVGRYLFGVSLLGSDEVQVFVMVAMTFLGAVVVTRRNEHLRMDVLVQFMPAPVRLALRIAEQLVLVIVAGFVLSQSYFYASQMLRIGRTSDMAGVPMWIPHGFVALGFALILLIAAWRLVTVASGREPVHSAPADGEVRE